MTFPLVCISGRPYARGVAYGESCAPLIRANCATTLDRLQSCHGVERRDIAGLRRGLDAGLEAHWPDLREEIEGIATGAGISVDEVLTLNAFPDIAFAPACTTAIVRDESSGEVRLFQNNDAFAAYASGMLVLEVDTGESRHLQVTYAGMVGESGVNEHGVAVAANSLFVQTVPDGVPFIATMRKILECRTVEDAVALIEGVPRVGGMTYALVDAGGAAAYLETSPRTVVRLPLERATAHTNACLSPLFRPSEHLPAEQRRRSERRLEAAREYVRQGGSDLDELLKRLARDHTRGDDGVCQHPLPAQDRHSAWQTLYSIVIDPVRRAFLLADGLPCQNDFRRLAIGTGVPCSPFEASQGW